ncbi:MAG: arylsulfatase [Verrucomicrobiae bacterium]|nr:arylsulfatase [Verrucomicrobiae bacterium]
MKLPLLFCLAIALFVPDFSGAAPANPHIVVILVDDMGYGDPGCYNPESKIATPNIDRLAAEGMRFTDAHAPGPLCHMSRYGLMTGRFPFRTDVAKWPRQPLIEENQTTIASLLKTAGYHTAMVGKWHCGFQEDGSYDHALSGGPADRGFDSFFGIRASTDIPPYFYIRDDRAVAPPTDHIKASHTEGWSPIQGAFWREGDIAPNLALKDVLPRFTEEAVSVIEHHDPQESPLMLYLAYPAPHTPWLPAPEFAGKSGAGLYGDFMMMVDAQIGRVLGALESRDMLENTLLVFTSDNGPTWYPEDVERLGHDSADGLRGMKADAWEAGHREPFVVRWPGVVKEGTVSDRTLSFTDLLATFADVTGTPLPDDAGPDSFSFLPVLKGETMDPRSPIVLKSGSGLMTIRSGDWKLIEGLGSGGFTKPSRIKPGPGDPEGQLYDLGSDLAESTNLFKTKPEVVARLRAEMKQIVDAGQSR